MNHLKFSPTPVEYLPYFSEKWQVHLLCKRDDLFQKAGGGSKARMLQYILYPLIQKKTKVLLTAGGPCSNYNRAAALMCAELGIKMKLVSYTNSLIEYKESLNYFLTQLAEVDFIYCSKEDVPRIIQEIIKDMEIGHINYQYLYGGGKSLEGIYAYYDAVKELRKQYEGDIDELYVACGTGTTLTGLCAGMQEFFPNCKVHGISVARNYCDEISVLKEDMACLNAYLETSYNFSNLIYHDEFILGGYGCFSKEELNVIKECISNQGMIIDPTYSGKAFYGMSVVLKKNKQKKKNVLFWNTGGIMNLLSQKNSFLL